MVHRISLDLVEKPQRWELRLEVISDTTDLPVNVSIREIEWQ